MNYLHGMDNLPYYFHGMPVRFVKEKRKSMCGLPCTDKGRESKTVPYDKITDCDVMDTCAGTDKQKPFSPGDCLLP